jgi:hypothetical protein
MFRASLCPSSGEQDCLVPHVVFSIIKNTKISNCDHLTPTTLPKSPTAHACAKAVGDFESVVGVKWSQLETVVFFIIEDTTCGTKQSRSLDDGHNDARNMLRLN